ncbi:hypothetical protein HNV12_00390 [Methanococcoides sp. SA1]|nr:hypothetical protein [Methanococcoides sp. SA1]
MGEIAYLGERTCGVVNWSEGEVLGSIPAIRLVDFNEAVNATDRELEIWEKYDALVLKGLGGLSEGGASFAFEHVSW